MAKLDLPHDPIIASKMVDLEAKKHERQQEGGWMGRIFGSSVTQKPGNIAAFVLIVSFIMFGAILFWGADSSTLSKKDQLVMVGGFITLALGFVFGRTAS
jgi:hypothetical protein